MIERKGKITSRSIMNISRKEYEISPYSLKRMEVNE